MASDATVASISLQQASVGRGRPLVFLHGLGASGYTWRHMAPAFTDHHEVRLVDLKGFGHSPKPPDDEYSLYDQARLVLQLILEANLRDVTLIGHSYGGGVALLVALRLAEAEPGRLHSLVLIDSIGYPQDLPGFVQVLRLPVFGWLITSLLPPETQVRHALRLAYHDDHRISQDAIERYAGHLAEPGGRRALRATARQLVPPDLDLLAEKYATLNMPILLVWGRHDEIVPLEVGRKLHATLPRSQLYVIEGSGHIPQEETPEEVLEVISKFLRNMGSGTTVCERTTIGSSGDARGRRARGWRVFPRVRRQRMAAFQVITTS